MKENAPQKENELHTMHRLMRYLSPQIAEIILKCPDRGWPLGEPSSGGYRCGSQSVWFYEICK